MSNPCLRACAGGTVQVRASCARRNAAASPRAWPESGRSLLPGARSFAWLFVVSAAALTWATAGCQWFVDDADRDIYRLIERRQRDALSETADARLPRDHAPLRLRSASYDFAPNPVDPAVPEAFQVTAQEQEPSVEAEPETRPADVDEAAAIAALLTPDTLARELSLAEALRYAFRHSREFQTAKEDLYLAALALSLERFLWTPQWVGEVSADYVNFGQATDFDQAMEAVAAVGFDQRLPFGGEVTARVINTLMRDMRNKVTTGESGQAILGANIPLLRGAGRVAFESRYQAERDLIYAVRAFEQFRRELAVAVAGDYFNLQQLRQEILNARASAARLEEDIRRARALWEAGRGINLDVQRAEQDHLRAISGEVDAIEAYQTSLDAFKLRLGMPTTTHVDVALPPELSGEATPAPGALQPDSLEDALRMPDVDEEDAIRVALKYRLDLLNDYDRIDDARRGVTIAENNLLPDLMASGSVAFHTDPDKIGVWKYDDDFITWRAGLRLELPLVRQPERNQLRQAQILKRRAERFYDLATDTVRLQVRRAMRRAQQEQAALAIQIVNRDLALKRRESARILFEWGRVGNRDIVEAETALLEAQNRLARAHARMRLAVLEFRRDTGTLRVDDDGQWLGGLASSASER